MAAALAAAAGDGTPDSTSATGSRPGLAAGPLAPSPAALAAMSFTPALASELQAGLRQSMQQLVRDQLAEQRRFMLATFEAFARRMTGELKEGIARIPPPSRWRP